MKDDDIVSFPHHMYVGTHGLVSFPHHTECLLTKHTMSNDGTHGDPKFSTPHKLSNVC